MNLNHLIRRALIIAIICGVALIAFLWIWPEGFLSLYNFDEIALSGFAINALKLYSFFFILTILPSMLIFYYEAIERSVLSTIFSVLSTLILPLVSIFVLYNMIGSNGIWLGFSVACIITTILIIITVKVIQRKEDKYEGLFFIEKELVHKTKNFVLTNNDTKERNECLQHLRSLNASEDFCDNTEKIFDTIFDTNDEGTYVEVLVIDYEDNIHLDIKYDGEKENLDHIKNNFPEGMLKYTEVLGFNDIEYVMKK